MRYAVALLLTLIAVPCFAEPVTKDTIEEYYAKERLKGDDAEHPTLSFERMNVGDIGIFPYDVGNQPFCTTKIDRILDANSFTMLVKTFYTSATIRQAAGNQYVTGGRPQPGPQSYVVVEGVVTEGQVDDKVINLLIGLRVTGTTKAETSEGPRTVYKLEPYRLPSLDPPAKAKEPAPEPVPAPAKGKAKPRGKKK